MADIEFAHKDFFWLLTLIPLCLAWYILFLNKRRPSINLSTATRVKSFGANWKVYLRHSIFTLRMLALAALIVAMARPQSSSSWQDVTTEGIDIIIAMDISGSMLAEDLKPNRIEASKKIAMDFIDGRPTDRIGLVVYSGESFTQCPLTTDHSVLKNLFAEIKNGMIEDGTAIGLGLANAVSRLKDSEAKSKVVILLTDGVNNRGDIPPLTAAEIAKAFKIRVYTIGVGAYGQAPFPFQTPFGGTVYQNVDVKIDEALMQDIARTTGGKYFRATNNESLKSIYQEIDEMEKSKIEVTEFRKKKEEFKPWLLVALALLAFEFLFRITIFRGIV
jgi:Ca-activated chloride channel family protein